jgi:hypothetical protein
LVIGAMLSACVTKNEDSTLNKGEAKIEGYYAKKWPNVEVEVHKCRDADDPDANEPILFSCRVSASNPTVFQELVSGQKVSNQEALVACYAVLSDDYGTGSDVVPQGLSFPERGSDPAANAEFPCGPPPLRSD